MVFKGTFLDDTCLKLAGVLTHTHITLAIKDKKPSPAKFTFRRTTQEEFAVGFIFFAKLFPPAGKRKQLSPPFHPPYKTGCGEEVRRGVGVRGTFLKYVYKI